MASPSLRLLGAPAVVRDGRRETLPIDLRCALLGVLASVERAVPRDHVSAVFWPDTGDGSARQNLRQLLFRTRRLLGREVIEASSTTLRVVYGHDLSDLRRALAAGDAVTAATLASQPLLDGLDRLPHPEWQAWLALERDRVREQVRRLLLRTASAWSRDGPPDGAVATLAAWVDADPYDDALLVAYLACARLAPAERASAGGRLRRATAVVAEELGAALPDSVLEAAAWLHVGADVARTERVTERPSRIATTLDPTGTAPHPPRLDLPLVGREETLRALEALVAEPSTRLVTVHGPGGVGKTRLVRAWLERRSGTNAMAPFVGLAGARDPRDAARRLSHALGWRGSDRDAVESVLERLRHGPDLVVYDEVEALPWFPTWLDDLLGGAPRLSVVVTSRERLGVAAEQLFPLQGLGVPGPGGTDAPSVRLFLLAARRARPDLRFTADDVTAIARFARRVEGSPLALGVAAGWVTLGPPARILDELLDADDDPLGIADVVGPTWSRLSDEDRLALAALSVFPDRFDVTDAMAVARCDRRAVRRLVDHALVQPGTAEGLALHALVRRHAARAMAERPEAAATTRAAHARHIARLVGVRTAALWFGPDQDAAHQWLIARLPDVRLAWSWACEQGDVEVLDTLADSVWCLELRNWNALGAELTSMAVDALERAAIRDPDGADLPLARMLARRGIFAQRMGDAVTTAATAERALAIFERRGTRVDPFALFHLGIAPLLRGDLEAAEAWHRRLLAEADAAADAWSATGAHGNLAIIARERGDLDAALSHAQAALTGARAIEDGWGTALAAANLASVLVARDEVDDGTAVLLEEALHHARRFGMESLQVEASELHGRVLARLGRRGDARAAFERALELLDAGALSDAAAPAQGTAPADAFRAALAAGLADLGPEAAHPGG